MAERKVAKKYDIVHEKGKIITDSDFGDMRGYLISHQIAKNDFWYLQKSTILYRFAFQEFYAS